MGLKVRGVYEAPGAEILIKAHFNLEKLVNTRDLNELKKTLDEKWAYLCYGAKWFDPSMDAIHAFQDSANQRVNGTVKVKLYKGKATWWRWSHPIPYSMPIWPRLRKMPASIRMPQRGS